MVSEDVLRLAMSEDEDRPNLMVPSVWDGWRHYSDGRIILAVPAEWPSMVQEGTIGEQMAKVLLPCDWGGEFRRHELPPVELVKGGECNECGGAGDIMCQVCGGRKMHLCSCGHRHECGTCWGAGMVGCEECEGTGVAKDRYEPKFVEIGDSRHLLAGRYAALLRQLPDVEWRLGDGERDVRFFRFDGGRGRGAAAWFSRD